MFDVKEENGVTVVEMVHGKANAMDLEFCRGMVDLLERLEREASAVVITARGGIFSAGVDLLRLTEGGAAYAEAFVPALAAMARALFVFRRPLVAAVNGHAIAGGCVLACAADRRIMEAGPGRIGVPEVRVGVPYPAAALEIMREATTPPGFRILVLDGDTVDAETAHGYGVVDEVVSADVLRERAIEIATRLASIPSPVFETVKAAMRLPAIERMEAVDVVEGAEVVRLWTDDAVLAQVRGYVERTLKRRS
jgi:enoyl-CoA hydratase/carnithine racemase